MDESVDDFNMRMIVEAARYFEEHFKVSLRMVVDVSATRSVR
jgi:hypothetical protein